MRMRSVIENRLVIGYARVSTTKQEISTEAQQERIEGNAKSKGQRIDRMIVDRESGKDMNRDGLKELWTLVESGKVSTVVIWKLDRLTRSLSDLCDLIKLFKRKNTELVSLNESLDTSTANGRLMINLIGSISEWERETISERTSAALQHKKSKNERVGSLPYGFTGGKNVRDEAGRTIMAAILKPDPTEQIQLEHMKRLRAADHSYEQIAAWLTENGYKTRRGSAWRHQYVRNILLANERQSIAA